MKKYVFILSILVIVAAVLSGFLGNNVHDFALEWEKGGLPQETRVIATKTSAGNPLISPSATKPDEINLAVPFAPQAPHADWSLPYQEACEETSALLVHYFYQNKNLTSDIANQEILKLVEWQHKRFGYYFHTTARETAIMLKEYFGYKRVDVLYDIGPDDIKEHLLAGRPVIVPFAGQLLGNQYYQQPGPVYHMLVVKGITKDGDFITNDVGTKRGQNYVYDDEVLFNAIHDAPTGGDGWSVANPEEYIKTGRKAIVVVYEN